MRTVACITTVLFIAMVPPFGMVEQPARDATTTHAIHGADERSRDQIADAEAAFRAAGLELPDLEIFVHGTFLDCDGMAGLFNRDGSGLRVDWCSGHPFTVLHEFAHAWEYHNVDDGNRAEFLELYGLSSWRGRDVPWAQRGAEMAAETIAQGLLALPFAEWRCNEILLLDEGFRLLTGHSSPRFVDGRLSCAYLLHQG